MTTMPEQKREQAARLRKPAGTQARLRDAALRIAWELAEKALAREAAGDSSAGVTRLYANDALLAAERHDGAAIPLFAGADALEELARQQEAGDITAAVATVRLFLSRGGTEISTTPCPPNDASHRLWRGVVQEEVKELFDAFMFGYAEQITHEAVDVIFSVIGLCVAHGLPVVEMWREVAAANLRKVAGEVVRNNAGKIVKPPGWVPADTARVMREACDVVEESTGEPETLRPPAPTCRHGGRTANGCAFGFPGCVCADEMMAAEEAAGEPQEADR